MRKLLFIAVALAAAAVFSMAFGASWNTGGLRGTTPTMGACGTTPSVVGNDNGMTVTVGTGGAATTCAVTFAAAFPAAPACHAQSNTDQATLIVATTTTTVTVTKGTAFTASSKLHIICIAL